MSEQIKIEDSFKIFINKVLINFASREFQGWLVATIFVKLEMIDAIQWIGLTAFYMGVRTYQKQKTEKPNLPQS